MGYCEKKKLYDQRQNINPFYKPTSIKLIFILFYYHFS